MDRSLKRKFNFVNLQHPDDLKDEETQLRIRRLAMTEVGKARRKSKTKRDRNEIVFELYSSQSRRVDLERIGAGQNDPFTVYPIDLDDSSRELLANSVFIIRRITVPSNLMQFSPSILVIPRSFEVAGFLSVSILQQRFTVYLRTLRTFSSRSGTVTTHHRIMTWLWFITTKHYFVLAS